MALLIAGLVLFLGIHSIRIVAEPLRTKLMAALGPLGFKGLYSLIALAGLVLIVIGYGQARLDPNWLYHPPPFLRHLNMLLMLLVFPALLAAYLPGRIQNLLKHPMLVAVKAWALAHLLVNGTLAAVLLFGGFLIWAVADRISVKRRKGPGSAPQLPKTALNDVIVVLGGLGLYVAFAFWLHPILFGVAVVG
ncbi:MAG: NnrU family protein [Wenzhouxiangella sp.]|nr:MAG: NnrU family protein [Wenzhouxiangella sp.]